MTHSSEVLLVCQVAREVVIKYVCPFCTHVGMTYVSRWYNLHTCMIDKLTHRCKVLLVCQVAQVVVLVLGHSPDLVVGLAAAVVEGSVRDDVVAQ